MCVYTHTIHCRSIYTSCMLLYSVSKCRRNITSPKCTADQEQLMTIWMEHSCGDDVRRMHTSLERYIGRHFIHGSTPIRSSNIVYCMCTVSCHLFIISNVHPIMHTYCLEPTMVDNHVKFLGTHCLSASDAQVHSHTLSSAPRGHWGLWHRYLHLH